VICIFHRGSIQNFLRGRYFPQPALRAVDVPDSRSSQGQAQTRSEGARAFGQAEDGGHRFHVDNMILIM
jgi:hypothetical protein